MAQRLYATFTYYDEFGNTVPADFTAYDYPTTYFTEEQLPILYKKQYNFLGWFINDIKADIGDSHTPFIPEGSERDTVTLVAKWEKLYYITDTPLKNIANAIRDRGNVTTTMTADEMASNISNLPVFFKNQVDLLGTEANSYGDFPGTIVCTEAPSDIYLLVDLANLPEHVARGVGDKINDIVITEDMYAFQKSDSLTISGGGTEYASNELVVSQNGQNINLNLHSVGYARGYSGTFKKKIILVATDSTGQTHTTMFRVSWPSNPCYLKDTEITLYNGLTKKVQDITYNDILLIWDFDNGCFASVKPLWIKKSQTTTEYYHCVFENETTLDLVGDNGHAHRVFCLDTNCFEYANNCVNKTVMTENGPTKMLSCDIVIDNVEFYNIITDHHMNCYANHILTSTGLSNIYPIENMKYMIEKREEIPYEQFINCPIEYYTGLRLGEQVNYSVERLNEKIQTMVELALPKGE